MKGCEVVSHYSFHLSFLHDQDVEHVFLCFLAVCISSFKKCLFRALAHFLKIWWLVFLLNWLYIQDSKPLSNISLYCPLMHKFFISMKSKLYIFSFVHHAFAVKSKNPLPNLKSSRSIPRPSSKSFTDLVLIFTCWTVLI